MSEQLSNGDTGDKENEMDFLNDRVGSKTLSKRENLALESRLLSVTNAVNEMREKEISFANVPQVAEDLLKKLRLCNGYSKTAYECAALKSIALDSNYFTNCSSLNCNLVKATAIDYQKFDCSTFAEKLITKLNAGGRVDSIVSGSSHCHVSASDFESLANEFAHLIADIPSFHFMFGAYTSEELIKEIKERKANKFKIDAPQKKPETIDAKDIAKNGDDLTAKSVESLYKNLRKHTKKGEVVPYFKFISDPESFSKTVENVFHSAFLVKEGHIDLSMSGSECVPVLKCVKANENEEQETNMQAVLSFSMEDWKKWLVESNSEDST